MFGMESWKKDLWIAKRLYNQNAEIEEFDKPKHYRINYQPMGGDTEFLAYGEEVNAYQKGLVETHYFKGVFKEGDRVYMDGLNYNEIEEEYYGEKANYTVVSVRNQNLMIQVIFKKIIKEGVNIGN